MSILDEIQAAVTALKRDPSEVLVAYLVNDLGYANLRKLVEHQKSKLTAMHILDWNDAGQMWSSFSGIPIHHLPALETSVCLFADGSTKLMLT